MGLFKLKKITKIITRCFFILFLLGMIFPVMALATVYQPGETLEPDCAPGSLDCGVAIFSLNGASGTDQTLVVGNNGTDFSISSIDNRHSFNIPSASSNNRGLLSPLDWNIFNNKQAALGYTPLNPANNLSDLSSIETARANLGLNTFTTPHGVFQEVFARKVISGQICLEKANGTELCLDGDQMDFILHHALESNPE